MLAPKCISAAIMDDGTIDVSIFETPYWSKVCAQRVRFTLMTPTRLESEIYAAEAESARGAFPALDCVLRGAGRRLLALVESSYLKWDFASLDAETGFTLLYSHSDDELVIGIDDTSYCLRKSSETSSLGVRLPDSVLASFRASVDTKSKWALSPLVRGRAI
jgi:hypothetical protein